MKKCESAQLRLQDIIWEEKVRSENVALKSFGRSLREVRWENISGFHLLALQPGFHMKFLE